MKFRVAIKTQAFLTMEMLLANNNSFTGRCDEGVCSNGGGFEGSEDLPEDGARKEGLAARSLSFLIFASPIA